MLQSTTRRRKFGETAARLGVTHDIAVQPIYCLGTGRVLFAEALSRFGSVASGETVAPVHVFTHAQRQEMSDDLELDAFRAALAKLPALPESVSLTINLSAHLLGSAEVHSNLAMLGPSFNPEQLIIEILETSLPRDPLAAKKGCTQLRARGIRFAVDDWGTGHAAALMRLFEPEVVKLDRSFVSGVGSPEALGHQLVLGAVMKSMPQGVVVIAEGVEHAGRDVPTLRRFGVDAAQGWGLQAATHQPAFGPHHAILKSATVHAL